MNRLQRGFTVLELIVAIIVLVITGTFFLIQKRDLEVAARDSERKTNINAIYYYLEEVYYPANQGYPQNLNAEQLKGLDPEALKDPLGRTFGSEGADYYYESKDCSTGTCRSYILSANLENEADFVRNSRN